MKTLTFATMTVMSLGVLCACAKGAEIAGPQSELALEAAVIITYDNNPYDGRLRPAWGFSCVIRQRERTILFDTGGDGAVLFSNMERLGVDPREVDIVVLSHIHGDHVGGLADFLRRNSSVTVYMPASFPQRLKDEVELSGARLEEVREARELAPGLFTTGEMGAGVREQSLVVATAEGLLVVTGCAHPGIVDIVGKAKELVRDTRVYLVMGGFHLSGASAAQIESIIDGFIRMGVEKVAPCHCSGDRARRLFEERYGDNYIESGVGRMIPLP